MNVNFEWDLEKSDINFKKHGVSFEEASTVFVDPHSLTIFDNEHSIIEDRFYQIGFSNKLRLLIVTFTELENIIRIINARKATKKETKLYENENI
jgi:uncharacterized protein